MSTSEDKDTMDSTKSEEETKDKKTKAKKNKKDKKPDPDRFRGAGVNFRAKLIGIESVPEARGDKMCQDAMQKVKAAVKAAGEHKQKILVNVSLEGLKILEEKSTVVLHHHAVHKISFISRDVNDARAFGYVYGPGEGKHEFYGIKTDKPAEGLVLSLRDLFQVVFEMKKREVELQKQKKQDGETTSESSPATSVKTSESKEKETVYDATATPAVTEPASTAPSAPQADDKPAEPAIGNLLDLNTELSFLQQGIAQMNSVVEDPPQSADTSAWATPWATPPANPQAGNVQFPVTFDSPMSPPQPVPGFQTDPFQTQPFMPPPPHPQAAMFAQQPTVYNAQGFPASFQTQAYPAAQPAAAAADPFQSDPFFSKPLQPGTVSSSSSSAAFSSSPALKNGSAASPDPFKALDMVGGNKPFVAKEDFFRSDSPSLSQLSSSKENLSATPPTSDPFKPFPSSTATQQQSQLAQSPGNPFA